MTQSPERIWAKGNEIVANYEFTRWSVSKWNGGTEYIRADLVDPAAIRETALRDAAEHMRGYGFLAVPDIILALIDKKET